ncbi:hypothetical protein FRC04_007921, partial [Tulasnella sp. 424]
MPSRALSNNRLTSAALHNNLGPTNTAARPRPSHLRETMAHVSNDIFTRLWGAGKGYL